MNNLLNRAKRKIALSYIEDFIKNEEKCINGQSGVFDVKFDLFFEKQAFWLFTNVSHNKNDVGECYREALMTQSTFKGIWQNEELKDIAKSYMDNEHKE